MILAGTVILGPLAIAESGTLAEAGLRIRARAPQYFRIERPITNMLARAQKLKALFRGSFYCGTFHAGTRRGPCDLVFASGPSHAPRSPKRAPIKPLGATAPDGFCLRFCAEPDGAARVSRQDKPSNR